MTTDGYCIVCDRMFCRHDAGRYTDVRFARLVQYAPVETAAGDRSRLLALGVLEPRYAALEERSRTEFRFSEIELQHMGALKETIATLHGMAPRGEIIPAQDSERLSVSLT